MQKQFVFNEVLSGFNEDIIISNKPASLSQGVNLDLETQPGSIRKRKGTLLFGSQVVDEEDVLGLFDFIKSDGSRVPLTAINDSVAITNASYSDPTITLTVASGHGIVAGDEIVVTGLAPSGYNVTATVTAVTATEIEYEVTGLGALTTTTGTASFSKISYYSAGWNDADKGFTKDANMEFETFIGYCFATNGSQLKTSSDGQTWGTTNLLNTIEITAVAYSDPTVTLTVPSGHEVEVGDEITISDLAPSGYNGTHTVTAVTDTTIAYSVASLGAVTDEVGSLTVQLALPANDVLKYSNYLFLIGLKDYGSDIMWSELPDKSDFSSDYTLSWSRNNNVAINLGDGEELVAGVEYRGALYLFKNSSVARAIAPIEVNGVKPLTNNIGAASKRSIQVLSGQLIFFCDGKRNAKKGIYSYNSLSDAEPQIISEPIQPYIDGMTAGHVPVAGTINSLYVIYLGAIDNDEYGISMTHAWAVFDAKTNRYLGVWDWAHTAKASAQLTQSDVTNLYVGDDDGQIWKMGVGTRDSDTDGSSGSSINLTATSQLYDISQSSEIRSSYTRRTVKNIWIYGDNLNGLTFRYRFDKKNSETEGWTEVGNLTAPVHNIPIQMVQAHLFQFQFSQTGKNEKEPIIRKIILEYE